MRVTYAGWEDARIVLAGQKFVVTWGPQGVEARIIEKKKGKGR